MKMRAVYQEKQQRWQAFRDAERQRRLDKAKQEEMNRLNGIIAESRARREYTLSKFQHTLTVRNYHQAAITIQRAFRRQRLIRCAKAKLSDMQEARRTRTIERAARVVQRSWRRYQQDKLYRALHFRSIMTGPVVALGTRTISPPGLHSYQRGTSITGKNQNLQNKRFCQLQGGCQNIIGGPRGQLMPPPAPLLSTLLFYLGFHCIIVGYCKAGSRGGSGGSNPRFMFQIILQCMGDVCRAFVKAHPRRHLYVCGQL